MNDNTAAEPSIEALQNLYDKHYYATGCGPLPYERNAYWANTFAMIADQIIRSLQPKRVLDAGCAMGLLVEAMWDRSVECYGIDLSPYAISQVRRDVRPYCRVDSITNPFNDRYDLITCIEVLEHIPPAQAEIAAENICQATDTILFSSDPRDIFEPTHCNVRPPIYWLNLFSRLDFWPCVLYDAGFIVPHAMLLRKGVRPTERDVLAQFSELLRYKAAYLRQVSDVTSLTEQKAALAQNVDRLTADLKSTAAERDSALSQLNQTRAAYVQSAESEGEGRKRNSGEAQIRDFENEPATSVQRNTLLDAEVRKITERAAQLQEENARLDSEKMLLLQQRNRLQQDLHDVVHSPAWKFIERYRSWLWRQRQARPWYFSIYEKLAARLVRASLPEPQPAIDGTTTIQAIVGAELHDARGRGEQGDQSECDLRDQVARLETERHEPQPEYEHSTQPKGELKGLVATGEADLHEAWRQCAQTANSEQDPTDGLAIIEGEPGPANPAGEKTESPAPFSNAIDSDYQRWISENEPDRRELRQQRETSLSWSYRPLLSVVVPVHRVSASALTECIQSVLGQSYENWELCVTYSYPEDEANRKLIMDFAASEPRIQVRLLETNLGISGNTNAALELSTGEYVVLLDHDDALAPSALYEAAVVLNRKPEIDIIYSDHDYIQGTDSARFQPLFKPDWSPEIMLSANYVAHLTVIRKRLVDEVGRFDSATDGAQDWDLFFRIVEKSSHIEHLPKVLYHWRVHPDSTALNSEAKSYVNDAQLLSISRHMERMGMCASPEKLPDGLLHVNWKTSAQPLVSIVIPSRDKVDLLSKCVSSILEKTRYASYEIISELAARLREG